MYAHEEIRPLVVSLIDSEKLHQLDLPADAKKALEVFDTAFDAFQQAHTHRETVEGELHAAMAADKQLLIDALKAGKGDPGTKATDKADRAAVVAQTALRIASENAQAAADQILTTCKPHRDTILHSAAQHELNALAQITATLEKLKQAYVSLNQLRHTIGTTYTAALDATQTRGAGPAEFAVDLTAFNLRTSVGEPMRQVEQVSQVYRAHVAHLDGTADTSPSLHLDQVRSNTKTAAEVPVIR